MVAALLLAGCIPQPPQSDEFELEPRLTNPAMPLNDESRMGLVEATVTTCDDVRCVEAWDSQHARYLRFATLEEAADYGAVADDAVVDRFIVIDYSNRDTRQQTRDDIESTVLVQMPPRHAPWGFFGL